MERIDPAFDAPRLVDNPFRRESHRPWYARRAARWFVGVLILLLFGLNAFAFKEVGQRADPITVDTALERYREATGSTTPKEIASGSSSTDVSVAGTPMVQAGAEGGSAGPEAVAEPAGDVGVARGATPAPGVYVYDTDGYEEVSALGGARHDYPDQSTMTVTTSDCGVLVHWAPLEQRFEDWDICYAGSAMLMRTFTTHHEFFGQTEERRYNCTSTYIRPPSDVAGTTANGACTGKTDNATTSATVVGAESVTIGGTPIDAIHIHIDQHVTGKVRGYERGDVWVRATDGALLVFQMVIDGDGDTVIGPTHFHEEINLKLADVTPRQ